jgi:branched-chain amino acid transport system substrate-binding protein
MRAPRVARWFVVLAAVGRLGAPGPASAIEGIRIGASISLTGDYTAWAAPAREAYLLCQKRVNEQGGLLGREVELLLHDDRSEWQTAVRLYEKLIVEDKVDGLLGPFSNPITEGAANVAEKHRRVMVAPLASTTSIWETGRKYLFMVRSPSEAYLEGLVDLAARHGLKTVGLIAQDTAFGEAAVKGAAEVARRRRLDVILRETYPKGKDGPNNTDRTDFSKILGRVKAAQPDVLGVASDSFWEVVHLAGQMKEMDVNVKMVGGTVGIDLSLGKPGDYLYSVSQWDIGLPYPGVKAFAEAYKKEYNRDPSALSAAAYGGCQLLVEAMRQAGSVETGKVREQLLKLRTRTVFGDYAVDGRGLQTGHKMVLFQWQDGKAVSVWPDDVAVAKPRFPTPPWNQR